MAEASSSPTGQPPVSVPAPETPATVPVVVKKYANRRLYNTETSSYITLDNLAEMIRAGRDFVVYDAKSGEDITRGVLTQIIVEEESKGSSMLPTAFLRQLIGFYGGSLQGVVPQYLDHAMTSFARQQQQIRKMMQQTLSPLTPFMPLGVEELSRQNMALFERAITMWNPFHRGERPDEKSGESAGQMPILDGEVDRLRLEVDSLKEQLRQRASQAAELERLRREVESQKEQLAIARAASVAPALTAVPPAVPENVRADKVAIPAAEAPPKERPARKVQS